MGRDRSEARAIRGRAGVVCRRVGVGALALTFAGLAVQVPASGQAHADPPPLPPIPGLPPPLGPEPEAPTPTPEPACSTATEPFVPTDVSVPEVDPEITVLAMRRDADGVPGAPPITREGKRQMAFDLDSGIRPGDPAGNALFNAHTWPDGEALGNALLADLQEGDPLVVRGEPGKLCYRVTERVEVAADDGAAVQRYYAREGDPQIAIAVCSGERLGPGNWTKRTLWFAEPVD